MADFMLSDLPSTLNDPRSVASLRPAEPQIPEPTGNRRRRFRTIWISDVHLGTKGCNADMLIDFLDNTDSETMYLVGDILDGWRLKKKFYWPSEHNDIVWRMLKLVAGKHHQPASIDGIVEGRAANFDATEIEARELAEHFIVIARNVDDPGASLGSFEHAPDNIVVL